MKGDSYKDFNFTFNDVDISKITPDIQNLSLGGKLNGNLKYKQDNLIYEPSTNLTIAGFALNDSELGDLKLKVFGKLCEHEQRTLLETKCRLVHKRTGTCGMLRPNFVCDIIYVLYFRVWSQWISGAGRREYYAAG